MVNAPVRRSLRFTIPAKLMVFTAVMLPVSLLVGWSGVHGMADMRQHLGDLHARNVALHLSATLAADVAEAADQAERVVAAAGDPGAVRRLQATFRDHSVPAVNGDLQRLATARLSTAAISGPMLTETQARWQQVLQRLPELPQAGAPQAAGHAALLARTIAVQRTFEPVLLIVSQMARGQRAGAETAYRIAIRSHDRSLALVLWAIGGMVAGGLTMVVALGGSFAPRIRRYARFATSVAAGDATAEVTVRGHDEISDLGAALNILVRRHRDQAARREAHAEFGHGMQLARTEAEAYELLVRHVSRSIPSSKTIALSRNNSANRIEARTPVAAETPVGRALAEDPRPEACLAVRSAQPHATAPGATPLIACDICGQADACTSCVPLVVSGEVIGSVLTLHQEELSDRDRWTVSEAVSLAAPALGHLRNLAVAEIRAATDVLTGLPNRRSVDHAVELMVAQAGRNVTPLSALALDVDHFKRVNDSFGHEVGDRVLAAVGAVLRTAVRASDFAGRAGGEEFLILLSDTARGGAAAVAEKIRERVAQIEVPEIEQRVTISIGIATMPDDAGSAEELLRHADQALYSAKGNGRNRTEVYAPDAPPPRDAADAPVTL